MAMHIKGGDGDFVSIPLLFSDVVEAGLCGGAGYVVAVAPRRQACGRGAGAATPTARTGGKPLGPPLDDVWIFLVDGTYLDLKEFFFELGSRGAVRWDLHDCYRVIPRSLGEGGYSKVFLGQSIIADEWKRTKGTSETCIQDVLSTNQVAVKTLKPCKEAENLIRTEIGFLAAARGHSNITRLYGVFCEYLQREQGGEDEQEATVRWSIVMELCTTGDLFDLLSQHGPLDNKNCAMLMLALFSALYHLHERKIVHRDVKPENILLGSDSRPMLADMGISATLDHNGQLFGKIGSPGYAAPEVVLDQSYNGLVDIFAAGCTYYYALTCLKAFAGANPDEILYRTVRCEPKYPSKYFRHVSHGLAELIKSCITKDPDGRPTAWYGLQAVLTWMQRNISNLNEEPRSAFELPRQSLDHQHAEAPSSSQSRAHAQAQSVGPYAESATPADASAPSSAPSAPSLAAGAVAEAGATSSASVHGPSEAASRSNQCVPPELIPSPPSSRARKPPRLPSRVPGRSSVLAEPDERQEIVEQQGPSGTSAAVPAGAQELLAAAARSAPAASPSARSQAEADPRAISSSTDAQPTSEREPRQLTPTPPKASATPRISFRSSAMLVGLARPAEQPEVVENHSPQLARQEAQQETLEKPVIALNGVQEPPSTPAAEGQRDQLQEHDRPSSRGRSPLRLLPLTTMHRMAGTFRGALRGRSSPSKSVMDSK
eukprot:TRINITY_DN2309_c0_g1_i1.p1 TRINITY_DN2309_c0_g1~~TRINITY_DN2309_c0_g1_i1.p1  ORF type:complete len:807 (-),score=117.68 TRINITY_DN2309_c0_g1_i1:269-2413(-)